MNTHYKTRYNKFIENIKKQQPRTIIGYSENHHIIPKCMHGTDDPENLILLSLKEHYLAHWLLWKAYPSYLPIASAFLQMTNKNPFTNKPSQGRITARIYEKLKTQTYDQISELLTDRVYLKDNEGKVFWITKDEYKAQHKYKFHTTGKIYVFNVENNTWEYIPTSIYYANKHQYKTRSSLEVVHYQFLDTETNEIIRITKPKVREKNIEYGYKRLVQIQNSVVKCIDNLNNHYLVSAKEYNSSIHQSVMANTFIVFDTVSNTNKIITRNEYDLNTTRYQTSTKGKVLAKDKLGNNILVTKQEFVNGEYVGQTAGLTTVFDKKLGRFRQVTRAEFVNDKANFAGPCQGKVNVIDKFTGERKQILKDQFDKTQYVGLGNKKFLFLCQNRLTNKQKFVNIYEWHLIKDQYLILDNDKFNKAMQLK